MADFTFLALCDDQSPEDLLAYCLGYLFSYG